MDSALAARLIYKGNTKSGALFSKCFKYRFLLWRRWSNGAKFLVFLMLNPSTADEIKNDPTVARCEKRARDWGYDGLYVLNIFAFRSTDPSGLLEVDDPVGNGNNKMILHIVTMVREAGGKVICAWGKHGKILNRGKRVVKALRKEKVKLHYLKLNNDGFPSHPLYLSFELKPREWIE
jgi:hypothetical protein